MAPPAWAARVVYALGAFGSALLQQTTLLWVFYFYFPPPGQVLPVRATPALIGLAMAVGRLVDALADPLVAHWSDSLRGPWGRRRPFILIASPLLAACFVLIWRPPAAGPGPANALYLTATLGVFFFLYTMVLNPYTALLPEVTAGGHGRVATASLMAAFNLAGIGTAFVASSWLSAAYGFPAMALILAPVGLAAILAAGLSTRERIPVTPPQPLRTALTAVLADRRFRVFVPAIASMWFGLSMVNLALTLLATVLMGVPRQGVTGVLAMTLLAVILSLPLSAVVIRRFGGKRTMLAAMVLLAAELPLAAGLGRWPVSLGPPLQGYIILFLAGPAIGALFVLPNALLAGIAEDHGRTGVRAEGMFFAFQGVIFNLTTSLSAAVLGGLLQWLGQAPPDALGLRVALLLAAVSTAVGAMIFWRYPEGDATAPSDRRRA